MCDQHCFSRRRFLATAVAGSVMAACGPGGGAGGGQGAVVPHEIEVGTSCVLDGMLLNEYPGPKAQVHYAGIARPDWFCDTVEMFNLYLNPEQVRPITGMFVQDMGKTPWDKPEGNWIDARSAFYVHGSKRLGSMGPTLASFSAEADAQAFAKEWGGEVLPFSSVDADMVVLDGGALHDQSM